MGTVLYNIIITPLELFIELVFTFMNAVFDNPGIAVIFVSIAVQLLCFPLYKRADDIQEQERQKQKEMERWVTHIKKTFKGDERFMMQQAYYREVGYKPIYAIKGSISLLLQVPFFLAAYNFLSKLKALEGVYFLGIADLSKPDQLIHIGSAAINLLPLLMTGFNIISGIIYTKGLPVKDKIQTYGLAILFLIILYKSPSGLVFYWTLNNFFSLFKNVILKVVDDPKKTLCRILIILGIAAPVYAILIKKHSGRYAIAVLLMAAVCIAVSVVYLILSRRTAPLKIKQKQNEKSVNLKLVNSVFYFSSGALVMLLALLIPIDVIKSSPVEFTTESYGPFGLILNTVCIYIGLVFVWINTFYIFSSPGIRKIFAAVTSIAASAGLIDYLFFAKGLGTMSSCFVYDTFPDFAAKEILINIVIVAAVAIVVFLVYVKKLEIVKRLNQILCLTLAVLTVMGSITVQTTLKAQGASDDAEGETLSDCGTVINLSRNGRNVIVFMLDRAISGYLPFIIQERPEIKEMFDGFTYYPNTLSFGRYTNFGAPALFGGYEYTPAEMNKRTEVNLMTKHDEALTLMPELFSENGFNVSVIDPPYAGYKSVSDLSIYDEYEGINAYAVSKDCLSESVKDGLEIFEQIQKRSTVFYGFMKALPVAAQNIVYKKGSYWSSNPFYESAVPFFKQYAVLQKMSELTEITDDDSNNFTMMQNSTTHEPLLFDETYENPIMKSETPAQQPRKCGGVTMQLSSKDQISHYQTNMASLLRIGEWLTYLKKNDVYDNTRIIIVSDHGRGLGQFDCLKINEDFDAQKYNPLFLVKDFNAKGFKTSDEFMTNADTPTLAFSGVISNPVNPFTGKAINNTEKTAHSQILTTSGNWHVSPDLGSQFDTSDGEWWSVEDNIFEKKNWKKAEVVQ